MHCFLKAFLLSKTKNINTEAPIFEIADYKIVGDRHEIILALALSEAKKQLKK